MTDYSELKRLAKAATQGEWRAGNAYDKPFIPKYQVIVDTVSGPYVILSGNQNFLEDAAANISFVGAANPVAVLALIAENERYRQYGCDTCDGSGHLHRIDGEYCGACTSCGAHELGQAKRERDQLKAENEALRKQIYDMSPLKGAPLTGPGLKCLACGGYHYGMSGLPCPKMAPMAQGAKDD